jgi:hypothetical protein
MGEVIRFVPKSEIERARLIEEARAIYDSIFPPNDAVSEQPDNQPAQANKPVVSDPIPFGKRAAERE